MDGREKYTLPALREHGGDCLVKVHAQPSASRDGVKGLHGDALKIAVAAAAEKGRANAAIERVLAEALGVRPSRVRLHSGTTSRDKWILVEGLDREALGAVISAVLARQ